jgi:hypothetical protein
MLVHVRLSGTHLQRVKLSKLARFFSDLLAEFRRLQPGIHYAQTGST